MTMTNARFDRELPAILDGLYLGPTPTYRDEVLAVATQRRQRPAWAIPGRWLPMADLASRPAFVPRVPLRAVAVALLIIAMAMAAIAIYIGSRQPSLPAPFGPAVNGHIAYAVDGDIYTADSVTGDPRALITGPEIDRNPVWSLDGTRIVFERLAAGEESGRLYVARGDGSGPTPITPVPLPRIKSVTFSPDGREVMFVSGVPGVDSKISIAGIDGSGVRTLDLPVSASEPAYRPPDGAEIAFTSVLGSSPLATTGVYIVNADGSGLRLLLGGTRDASAGEPRWSPDGSRIAYSVADLTVPYWTTQTRIVSPDGRGDRTLPMPTDAKWSYNGTWSNDGNHLVMIRGYSAYGPEDLVTAVVPVDGSGPGVETDRHQLAGEPVAYTWAPDDTSILVVPAFAAGHSFQPLLIDPSTGAAQTASWPTTSTPAWQRLAK